MERNLVYYQLGLSPTFCSCIFCVKSHEYLILEANATVGRLRKPVKSGFFFGSYFFSIVCLYIFFKTYDFISQEVGFREILITIIFSSVAQIGDLGISYFKRLEKIKDTGKILPGHGGIFDRIDGLMFVVILAFIINFFKI